MAAAAITEKFVGSSTSGALELPSTSTLEATSSNPTTTNGATSSNPNCHSCYGYEEVVVGMDVVEDHHHHQQKVPIWVGLNCKLVSGISKSTTCHDLISSIVPSSQEPSKYVLVEKWKKMERILDPSVKILKVWKAWGDQIGDVSFVLRSSPTADGYIDKKSSRKVHRKRSSSYHQQKMACHEEDCDQEGHRDAMEQLIKLVITQGEAIQAQLKKLRQQEVQIERYEEKMHKIRSSQLGENYVVDTYLKDDIAKGLRRVKRREKSPCKRDAHGNYHHHHHHHHHHRQNRREHVELSQLEPQQNAMQPVGESESSKKPTLEQQRVGGGDELEVEESTDLNDDSSETIKEKTELMESIFQLNLKLTQEEERLVKLGLKIRKLSDKQRKAEWEELALQDITQELEHLKQVTNEQSQEIEINERNLTALEQLLDDKHDHVAFLTHEIQLMDEESEMLQKKVLEMAAMEAAVGSSSHNHVLYHHPHNQQSQHVFHSHIEPSLEMSSYPAHLHHMATLPEVASEEQSMAHQELLNYPVDNEESNLLQSSVKSNSRGEPVPSFNQHKIHPPIQNSTQITAVSSRYKCPQEQQIPQQQSTHDSCSSSCSNSSSSVCVQLSQKCTTTSNSNMSSDPQDNDSNSDTGISSLHSSVDENPMYVLDTLV